MIALYCRTKDLQEALSVKESLQKLGIRPTVNIYVFLVRALLAADNSTEAEQLLEDMKLYSLSPYKVQKLFNKE